MSHQENQEQLECCLRVNRDYSVKVEVKRPSVTSKKLRQDDFTKVVKGLKRAVIENPCGIKAGLESNEEIERFLRDYTSEQASTNNQHQRLKRLREEEEG